MICPKCAHTMNDDLTYCECCGTYLAAPQPKVRVVSTSTYRLDLYAAPEGDAVIPATPQTTQNTTTFYNMYQPAPQMPAKASSAALPQGAMRSSANAARKQRRSRKMHTIFSVGIISMLLLGFTGGMSAFAVDDEDSRMPIVVEYEETVTPETDPALLEATETDTVTILDDPVPMASPWGDSVPAAEPPAAQPEATPEPAPAIIASAIEQPTETVIEPLAPRTLEVNGVRVPYIHSVFATLCPDNNAALWAGSDDTTDGSFGYFIGHNPGDFACVFSLVPGNYVTLCDSNGNLRNYTVTQLYDVPNTTVFQDMAPKVIPEGESLILQTCIGDGSTYRIVVCQ